MKQRGKIIGPPYLPFLLLQDLCPQADSLWKTGPLVAAGDLCPQADSLWKTGPLVAAEAVVSLPYCWVNFIPLCTVSFFRGTLLAPSILPFKGGERARRSPRGLSSGRVFLSVGVSLCIPPWS